MAGATTTGEVEARYNVLRKSSATPLANFASTSAVAGATSNRSVRCATAIWSMAESRLPSDGCWYAPKGTPKPIIDKLSAALQKALQDPDVQERLAQSGAETVPAERAMPEVLRDHLKAEIDRWVPIIRKAGVLAQ